VSLDPNRKKPLCAQPLAARRFRFSCCIGALTLVLLARNGSPARDSQHANDAHPLARPAMSAFAVTRDHPDDHSALADRRGFLISLKL